MPPHSPAVRQLLAAQFAEDRRLEALLARNTVTRPRRRRRSLPRPLAALRARRAAAACATC